MAKIAIVYPPKRALAEELANSLNELLTSHGSEVHLQPDSDVDKSTDFIVSVGGDGTVLWSVGIANEVPILGINMGHRGYLTEVDSKDAWESVERMIALDFEIDSRNMVKVEFLNREDLLPMHGLNEVNIVRSAPGKAVRVRTTIDNDPFLIYTADGILISTATGSTGYNASVGGPIISPQVDCLVLTPVSPHLNLHHSVVLEPESEIVLEVMGIRTALAIVDGERQVSLNPGDLVRCKKSEKVTNLIRFNEHESFTKFLISKLSNGS